MANIKLDPSVLLSQADTMSKLGSDYEGLFKNVTSCLHKVNSNWSDYLANNFSTKITYAQMSFSEIISCLDQGVEAARNSAITFEDIDSSLAKYLSEGDGDSSQVSPNPVFGEAGNVPNFEDDSENKDIDDKPSIIGDGISGAVVSGTIGAGLVLGGIAISGSASGDLIGGKVSAKIYNEWEPRDGNAGIGAEIEASGHIAEGEVKVNVGAGEVKIKGSVGNAAVKGKVGASLYKDGKLDPSIEAKASAEASVAKGEISEQLGSKDYNVHAKAKGSVLEAKAEASMKVGKQGVEAKAGAEAYVATGEVSGGITLFGVKIDASVKGGVGGAGLKAGGKATGSCAEGEIGAGLGLGGSLKIKVDWSNFALFRKKKH